MPSIGLNVFGFEIASPMHPPMGKFPMLTWRWGIWRRAEETTCFGRSGRGDISSSAYTEGDGYLQGTWAYLGLEADSRASVGRQCGSCLGLKGTLTCVPYGLMPVATWRTG